MKTKKIYIIRHGETDYNLKSMVQGRGINASLNDTGKQQAQLFFDQYQDVAFDKLYSSALTRTTESIAGFIDKGIPHESLTGLDEISWGTHEGKAFSQTMHEEYTAGLEAWKAGKLNHKIGEGESPIDVMKRQKEAMKHIFSQEDEKTILISTHGRAMRILLCHILNYDLKHMDMFEHGNLCLYKLAFTGSMFSLDLYNQTDHLK